jgi:hypothetical protein
MKPIKLFLIPVRENSTIHFEVQNEILFEALHEIHLAEQALDEVTALVELLVLKIYFHNFEVHEEAGDEVKM